MSIYIKLEHRTKLHNHLQDLKGKVDAIKLAIDEVLGKDQSLWDEADYQKAITMYEDYGSQIQSALRHVHTKASFLQKVEENTPKPKV